MGGQVYALDGFRNHRSLPDIAEAMALPLDRIGIKICAESIEGDEV